MNTDHVLFFSQPNDEEKNSSKEMWESFTIGDLIRTVSGESVAKQGP